jgi:pimeloyl-ACP methyl ester carboxylesterase
VWKFWQQESTRHGWAAFAVDLRGHGNSTCSNLAHASMEDYAADVRTLVRQFHRRAVLMGWSLGGLVAMMVAASDPVAACVGLAPSVPAQRADTALPLRLGEFVPEEYGIRSMDPENQPEMPDLDREERMVALASLGHESRLARDERKRGIIIHALSCPLLIVTGTQDKQWPRDRYDDLWLAADHLSVEGASHWGLVLNRRALSQAIPSVLRWIYEHVGSTNT